VQNIVMVGFFAAATGLLDAQALRQAVDDSVPPAFRELNGKAFDKGFEYGASALSAGETSYEAEPLQEPLGG